MTLCGSRGWIIGDVCSRWAASSARGDGRNEGSARNRERSRALRRSQRRDALELETGSGFSGKPVWATKLSGDAHASAGEAVGRCTG